MFDEFNSLVGAMPIEELNVIANQVIAGLEKIAAADESLAKEAENEDIDSDADDPLTKTKLIVGALAGAAGTSYLAHKIPEWKYNRAISSAVNSRNKQKLYEQKYNAKMRDADAALGGLYGSRGLGSAPGGPNRGGGGYPSNSSDWHGGGGNRNNKRDMRDPNKRVSSEINGEVRNPGDVGSDVSALKAKDFLMKNKMPVLAGGGVAAYMALNKNEKDKLESELRGSYVNGGRGRI